MFVLQPVCGVFSSRFRPFSSGGQLPLFLFFMISPALIHDPSSIQIFTQKLIIIFIIIIFIIIIEILKNNNYFLATLIAITALINLFFYRCLIYSTSLTTFPTNDNSINIHQKNSTCHTCLT